MKLKAKFIRVGVPFILVAFSFIGFKFWQLNKEDISVWQGFTSADQASFVVLLSKDENLSYQVKDSNGVLKEVQVVGNYQREDSNWTTEHLQVSDLSLDETYQLIIEKSSNKKFKKTFKTLDLKKDSFTLAVASCMDDRWNQKSQDRIWKDLLSHKPDMVFLIGDNVYADKYVESKSPTHFYKRFVETVQTLKLYRSSHLVPVLAVWDDHDYGFNNGHKDFIHKEEMQKLFRGFYPLFADKKNLIEGPGISFLLKTGHQNFFFMDDRSFRDADSKGSFFGRSQEDWALAHMVRWNRPSWMMSGGQFIGFHHKYESFERDFPQNFNSFFKKLSQIRPPVFFVSGDRHLTEFLSFKGVLPYETYELTTSGIHAVVYPPEVEEANHPRILHHIPEKNNYAIVKSQAEKQALSLNIQVYGPKKSLLFSEEVQVQKK